MSAFGIRGTAVGQLPMREAWSFSSALVGAHWVLPCAPTKDTLLSVLASWFLFVNRGKALLEAVQWVSVGC